jgi:acetylornithine/succinyldiaminopimelate/putrescine aminotransferase
MLSSLGVCMVRSFVVTALTACGHTSVWGGGTRAWRRGSNVELILRVARTRPLKEKAEPAAITLQAWHDAISEQMEPPKAKREFGAMAGAKKRTDAVDLIDDQRRPKGSRSRKEVASRLL